MKNGAPKNSSAKKNHGVSTTWGLQHFFFPLHSVKPLLLKGGYTKTCYNLPSETHWPICCSPSTFTRRVFVFGRMCGAPNLVPWVVYFIPPNKTKHTLGICLISLLMYPITNPRVYLFFCIKLMEEFHDRQNTTRPTFLYGFPSPRHSGPDSLEAFVLLSFCSSSRCLSAHPWDGIFTVPWMVDFFMVN